MPLRARDSLPELERPRSAARLVALASLSRWPRSVSSRAA